MEGEGRPQQAADRRVPLLWRILATNAAVIAAAVAAIAFSPAQIPQPVNVVDALVVVGGLVVVLVANMILLRRALQPLQRLTESMRRVDPLEPGGRIPAYGTDVEVTELTEAFNEMLGRLEAERRESTKRTLAAQEGERLRISRELHDEIGQRLTATLLQLTRTLAQAPPELHASLSEAMETTRGTLEEVRTIAAQLRPVALDDLGLVSALGVLAEQVSEQADVPVRARLAPVPSLGGQTELVIYRVAQEALTNAIRHAGAARIEVALGVEDGAVRLAVTDDGGGTTPLDAGSGIQGMRERAMLIGATLSFRERRAGGLEVALEVPLP